jgi:hypothetical protein
MSRSHGTIRGSLRFDDLPGRCPGPVARVGQVVGALLPAAKRIGTERCSRFSPARHARR